MCFADLWPGRNALPSGWVRLPGIARPARVWVLSCYSWKVSWSSDNFTDVSWYSLGRSELKNFRVTEFRPDQTCLSELPSHLPLCSLPAIGFSVSYCSSYPCWLSLFLVEDSAHALMISIAQSLPTPAIGSCFWWVTRRVSVEARQCPLNRLGSTFRARCTFNVLLRSVINAYMEQHCGSSLAGDLRLRVKVAVVSTSPL
jgi:hypothetical protein